MYPLTTDQAYPQEQWWVAAYSSEVTSTILARDILGEPVILYRTDEGQAVALSGICPHRAFPLAKGRLLGNAIQCGYHGFTFGPDGHCTKVPSQKNIPQRASLRRYPIVEQGGLIWIWTGQGEPNEARIVDTYTIGLGNPDWAVEQHPLATVEARYTLMIENLLDLSHVTFIHSKTIPGGEKVAEIPVALTENEHSLTVQRKGHNMPLNPLVKMQFPDQNGPVDQEFDAEYLGPCMIRTGGSIIDSATGIILGTQNFIHMITPATPTRLHYFVNTARNFGTENPALSEINIGMSTRIQPEDVEAIEAIERILQSGAHLPTEISARVDNGALKVRRRLEQQIKAELPSIQ